MEYFLVEKPIEANPQRKFIHQFRQILLSSSGLCHGMSAGAILGYSSIIFSQMKNEKSFFENLDQESWIAASTTLAMFPATLCCGWALEKFGRKFMSVLGEIINLLGWLITYFAGSFEILIIGRLISGIYAGMGYPIYLTYLGEITVPKYRAFCLTLLPVGGTFGVLIIQLLGNYLHWKIIALLFIIPPLYNLGVLYYVKDSYIWYINRNELQKARKAFVWFKGTCQKSQEEFSKATVDVTKKQNYSLTEIIKLCLRKTFLKPFGITTLVYLTNEFSGTMALIFYTSLIIDIVTKDEAFQYYSTTTLNSARVIGIVLSAILVKKISVKTVLIVSSYALGLSLLNLSLFLYLSQNNPENTIFPIICLISLIGNVMFFGIGLNPLPSVVCGELYPGPVRGIGCSLSAAISFALLFLVVKVMPSMFDILGPSMSFLIFGCCTLIGITITCFVLPNTKNKTLKEIEDLYQSKN